MPEKIQYTPSEGMAFVFLSFCTFPLGKTHLVTAESNELGNQIGKWCIKRGVPIEKVPSFGIRCISKAEAMLRACKSPEEQSDLFTEILQKISRQSWYGPDILAQIVASLTAMMNANDSQNVNQVAIIDILKKLD